LSTVVKCQCPPASEGESDIECILVRWVKGVNLAAAAAAAAAAVKASIDQKQQFSGSSRPTCGLAEIAGVDNDGVVVV